MSFYSMLFILSCVHPQKAFQNGMMTTFSAARTFKVNKNTIIIQARPGRCMGVQLQIK